ncbi:hypothetical protein D3C71_1670480 [compost metagenome]
MGFQPSVELVALVAFECIIQIQPHFAQLLLKLFVGVPFGKALLDADQGLACTLNHLTLAPRRQLYMLSQLLQGAVSRFLNRIHRVVLQTVLQNIDNLLMLQLSQFLDCVQTVLPAGSAACSSLQLFVAGRQGFLFSVFCQLIASCSIKK